MITNDIVDECDSAEDRAFRLTLLKLIADLEALWTSADDWQRELLCEALSGAQLKPRDRRPDTAVFAELRQQAQKGDFRAVQLSEQLKDLADERLEGPEYMRVERWIDRQSAASLRALGAAIRPEAGEFLVQRLKSEASRAPTRLRQGR